MEEIKIVKLINKGYKIKVACSNAIDQVIINHGLFISVTANGQRVASLMECIGSVSTSIWEAGSDGIHRKKMDVNITLENKVQIEKTMPDGSERRMDVEIIF